MHAFPTTMYALVGELTMARTSLLSMFSWKRGFLANGSQCTTNTKTLKNTMPEEQQNRAGLAALPVTNLHQPKFEKTQHL